MEDITEPQVMNDEQHLQELKQRINAKAENLVKRENTEGRKSSWKVIAVCAVFIAIIIAVEVYSYMKNDSWEFKAWATVTFVGVFFIIDRILTIIMRRFLTGMKNASTAPSYYREVKRLITTHKLRLWIPFVVAMICGFFVEYGSDSWSLSLVMGSWMVLGAIWGASMRNWFLDDDFCFDVDELGEMIDQESAA